MRIAMFGRKHQQLQGELSSALARNESLTEQINQQKSLIQTLEHKLSLATITSNNSPESKSALMGLRDELDVIISTIDECITLLEKRI